MAVVERLPVIAPPPTGSRIQAANCHDPLRNRSALRRYHLARRPADGYLLPGGPYWAGSSGWRWAPCVCPAMLLMGMPAPIAGGTNILVSSLASLAGTIRHLRAGRVNLRIVLTMGVPAFTGAFIGGLLSDRTPDELLIALAGALVFWQGAEFLIIARNRMQAGRSDGALFGAGLEGSAGLFTPRRVASEGVIGFAVGMLGGAVGLILGSIRLPALVRILRVDPRIAAGTNLFIGFVMGGAGWVGHVLLRAGGLDSPGADGRGGDGRQLPWAPISPAR